MSGNGKSKTSAKKAVAARQPKVDAFAMDFAATLQKHLNLLDWNKAAFAIAAKEQLKDEFYAAQLTRWQYGIRTVSRGMAIRVAVVLALEYEKRRRDGAKLDPMFGLDNLDVFIQDFLNAAGYQRGKFKMLPPTDLIWELINSKKQEFELLIGYCSCPPWANKGIEKPSGVAIEVAGRVMTLLGFRHRFQELSWGEMPLAIRERRVHLIAPLLMKAPARLFDFSFSDPVSHQHNLGIGFIAAKHFCKKKDGSQAVQIDHLIAGYSLGYISGEVGEVSRAMLKSNAEVECNDVKSGALWVKEGISLNECRILAYERASCEKLVKESDWRDQLCYIKPPASWEDVRFYVCFGAHTDEPRLINAVNECLPLIKGYIDEEFRRNNLVTSSAT